MLRHHLTDRTCWFHSRQCGQVELSVRAWNQQGRAHFTIISLTSVLMGYNHSKTITMHHRSVKWSRPYTFLPGIRLWFFTRSCIRKEFDNISVQYIKSTVSWPNIKRGSDKLKFFHWCKWRGHTSLTSVWNIAFSHLKLTDLLGSINSRYYRTFN